MDRCRSLGYNFYHYVTRAISVDGRAVFADKNELVAGFVGTVVVAASRAAAVDALADIDGLIGKLGG